MSDFDEDLTSRQMRDQLDDITAQRDALAAQVAALTMAGYRLHKAITGAPLNGYGPGDDDLVNWSFTAADVPKAAVRYIAADRVARAEMNRNDECTLHPSLKHNPLIEAYRKTLAHTD